MAVIPSSDLRVIVQELGRSENRRGGNHLVVLPLDIGSQDRLLVYGKRFLDGLMLARRSGRRQAYR